MPNDVPFLGDFFVTSRRGAEPLPGRFLDTYSGYPGAVFTGPLPEPPPSPEEEPLAEVVVEADRLPDPVSSRPIGWGTLFGGFFGSALPQEKPARRRMPPRRSPKPPAPRRPRPPAKVPRVPGKAPWWMPKIDPKWWWPKIKPNPALAAALAATAATLAAIESGVRQTVARATPGPPKPPPTPWAVTQPRPAPARAPQPLPAPLPWLGTVTVAAPRPLPLPLLRPLPVPMLGPLPVALPVALPLPGPLPVARPLPLPGVLPTPFGPRPIAALLNPTYGHLAPLPGLGPIPKEELARDKCKDAKDKKKKKKKEARKVCYRGTYKEFSFGLTKSRKEEVPCQLTAPRKGRKLPKPADILPFPKRI